MIKYLDVYNKALIKLRKEASGRALRPADFKALIPEISERHFNYLLDNYEKDSRNSTSINRFFKSMTLTSKNISGGEVSYILPTDHAQHRNFVMVTISGSTKGIDILSDVEYSDSMKSYIFKPRSGKEKAIIRNGYLVILSDSGVDGTSVSGTYHYIRDPEIKEFLYTASSTGITQSNNDGFDFDDGDEEALVDITLELVSVGLKRQDTFQYSKARQMEDNR